jgi:hypothetical protein
MSRSTSVRRFTLEQLARLASVDSGRARSWMRRGLFDSPTGPAYDFQDLVALRALVRLLNAGVPERRVAAALRSLKSRFPAVERPLVELHVEPSPEARVLVRQGQNLVEPEGQIVLSFAADPA